MQIPILCGNRSAGTKVYITVMNMMELTRENEEQLAFSLSAETTALLPFLCRIVFVDIQQGLCYHFKAQSCSFRC